MSKQEVMVNKLTRREVREAMEAGQFQAAIVPTGAIEQHLEHLAMEHDIRTATWIAREVALRMFPQVIVGVPMNVGISEHHMIHKGSMTAKPGSWMAVLFDAVESFVRHGCRNVLILNGHGGNEAPMYGIIRQWQIYFRSTHLDANVQFQSYWNLSRREAEAVCSTGVPGHANEYETSMALALFPESVRVDAMEDEQAQLGTAEKGRQFAEFAVERTKDYLEGMMSGRFRGMFPPKLSVEMDPKVWD